VVGVGYEFDALFPELITRVTREDVLRVSRRYLTNHVLVVVAPATAK